MNGAKKQDAFVKNGHAMPLLLSGIITTAFLCTRYCHFAFDGAAGRIWLGAAKLIGRSIWLSALEKLTCHRNWPGSALPRCRILVSFVWAGHGGADE